MKIKLSTGNSQRNDKEKLKDEKNDDFMGNFILMVDRFLCDCASIFMLTIVLFLLNTFDVPNFCTNLLVIFVPVFYLALNFYLTIEYCHDECASKYGCQFYDSHLIFTMIYYFIVPIPMFCFFIYLITDSMFSVPHLIMFFCSGYFTLTPSLASWSIFCLYRRFITFIKNI